MFADPANLSSVHGASSQEPGMGNSCSWRVSSFCKGTAIPGLKRENHQPWSQCHSCTESWETPLLNWKSGAAASTSSTIQEPGGTEQMLCAGFRWAQFCFFEVPCIASRLPEVEVRLNPLQTLPTSHCAAGGIYCQVKAQNTTLGTEIDTGSQQ